MRIKDILATTAAFVATAGPALARAGAPIENQSRDLKRGLVTMCAAGGMAPAIIIERL